MKTTRVNIWLNKSDRSENYFVDAGEEVNVEFDCSRDNRTPRYILENYFVDAGEEVNVEFDCSSNGRWTLYLKGPEIDMKYEHVYWFTVEHVEI